MKLAVLLLLMFAARAFADDCLPQVRLDGDPALVAQLRTELAWRGIATSATPDDACPTRIARVERDGDTLVISISDAARTVSEVKTAAAVIESFVRDDVGSPLLAIRLRPRPRPAPPAVAPSVPQLPRGWHFFGAVEASIASDRSRWMGMQLGACRMVGVLCAALRLRGGSVKSDEGPWTATRRDAAEVLLGFDVPFRIRGYLVMPGVALGFGSITTEADADTGDEPSRSNNFRGQAHVSLAVPLSRSFALDISVAGTLTQQVDREPGYMTNLDEPLGYLRLGVGVRYGSR